MQDFRRERHSVSKLTVHLVCVTKYRRNALRRGGKAINIGGVGEKTVMDIHPPVEAAKYDGDHKTPSR